jgi:hypothetical protein
MGDTAGGEYKERSRMPAAFAAGLIVVMIIVGAFELITRSTKATTPSIQQHLPFGPAEQKAVEHVHLQDLRLSQATNFLNQEFTFISGVLSNDGVNTLLDAEVVMEFRDPFNQVVLKETRRVFGPNAPPLYGGQKRSFEITLDSVPATWNKQYPSIRITGLALQ